MELLIAWQQLTFYLGSAGQALNLDVSRDRGNPSSSVLQDRPSQASSSELPKDSSPLAPHAAATIMDTAMLDSVACLEAENQPQLACSIDMLRQRLQARRQSDLSTAPCNGAGQQHAFAAASLQVRPS